MEAFKERLLIEQDELIGRRKKLNDFIENEDKFKQINITQQRLLIEQNVFMKGYEDCLAKRINDIITDEEFAEYMANKINNTLNK